LWILLQLDLLGCHVDVGDAILAVGRAVTVETDTEHNKGNDEENAEIVRQNDDGIGVEKCNSQLNRGHTSCSSKSMQIPIGSFNEELALVEQKGEGCTVRGQGSHGG
jgi:hypothetical protein